MFTGILFSASDTCTYIHAHIKINCYACTRAYNIIHTNSIIVITHAHTHNMIHTYTHALTSHAVIIVCNGSKLEYTLFVDTNFNYTCILKHL